MKWHDQVGKLLFRTQERWLIWVEVCGIQGRMPEEPERHYSQPYLSFQEDILISLVALGISYY
jgi:hypothetical protein